MKKMIFFTVLMIAAVACFSCKKEAAADYTCSEALYSLDEDGRAVNVAYPAVSGTGDDEQMNSALKDAALENMELYLRYTNSDGFYRYTVDSVSATYQSAKLASFLCVGSYTDEGSSHPDPIVYTININPQSGKVYAFEELVSDFDLLADKFKAGKFKLVSGADGLLDKTNYEDMFIEYSSLYKIYPPIYIIGGDSTELAFSIGLVYTLGGHAEFSIGTDSVKNALTDTLSELLN